MGYITIAEYANIENISKQMAYKRAKNGKYKGYFRKINGALKVDCSIFELNQNVNQFSTVENEEIPTDTENLVNQNSTEFSTTFSTNENQLIKLLNDQLVAQGKQIEKLYDMIAEKDLIIKDLSSNMAQITNALQSLQHEQNLLEASKIQAENISVNNIPKGEQAEPPKKGLFSRLWKH